MTQRQRGMTVLIITTALMLVSMLFILFATQYSLLQQRISANLYRNQQAFEAAAAGLEAALPYFQANYSAIVATKSHGYLTPYVNSSTANVSLANSSQYSFTYLNLVKNNYQLIQITATGTNADASSTRRLTQAIQAYSSSMPTPTVSLTTQGTVSLSNTAAITNTQTNSNISSGGSLSFSDSAHTTTSAGINSNAATLGNDVSANNTTLAGQTADAFFQTTFGISTATLKSNAKYTYSNVSSHTYNNALNGVNGAIIWVDQLGGTATISGTTTLGSAGQPVILVVNGNLLLDESAVINGFVFILNPTTTVLLNRNAIVNGAIAGTGSLSLQSASALNYNTSILNALPTVNNNNYYAKVPASWRDF